MKVIQLIFLVVISLSATTLASTGDGGYAGAFLRMGVGSRARAMGDAYTATADGASSILYNPAVLSHMETRQAVVSLAFLPLDRSLDYVAFATPLRPHVDDESAPPMNAGLGVAWVHAGVDQIDGRSASGEHTQYYSNSEHAFYMSFSASPSRYLSFGVSGKVLVNRMPGLERGENPLTSSGFGIDLGLYSEPIQALTLGVALRDIMSRYTWSTDKVYDHGTSTTYDFPRVVRVAAAYQVFPDWMLLVADMETSDKQNPRYHFGTEFAYPELGALRLGLDHDMLTFGLGFYLQVLGIDTRLGYAFVNGREAINADHVVSWVFDF
ncbi:MAG: hypothetical protein U5R06_20385 [candidate division KSB1 bacterium]|nr:hypothetical protein [candidate division KSB1 bacterium]